MSTTHKETAMSPNEPVKGAGLTPMAWMAPSGRLYKTRMMALANCEQMISPLYALTPDQVAALAAAPAQPDAHMQNLQREHAALRKAAQAVVERWDSPHWRCLPSTSTFLNDLRAALVGTEPAQLRQSQAESAAIRTLKFAGYTYLDGAEHWKPPLGKQLSKEYAELPEKTTALIKRTVFDAIRSAYDLGYNDSRNASAVPKDSAPRYKGRDVEADHGGALMHRIDQLLADATHALRIQQPAPSAAPAGRFFDERAERLSAREGYEKRTSRASERNHHDQSMYALGWWDRAWKAAQPTTTPQADSQPAPVSFREQWAGFSNIPQWPIAPDVSADLERSDWTPEEALRWYAAGKHYDTVPNGDGSSSARILDNGAVASNALKSLSSEYAEHKGDVALLETHVDSQPAPLREGEWINDAGRIKWLLWRVQDLDAKLAARAPADSVLKDHQIAALVNELRDIAIEFHGAQQLRERIAQVVVPALKAKAADSVLKDAARYRHLRDCNSGSLVVMQITGTGEDDWHVLTEDDADAAIDAARAPADSQPTAAQHSYSIDADQQGIRARVADAITGALAFGAQGTNQPPSGHWLEPFWDAAQADSVLEDPARKQAHLEGKP